MMLMKWMQNLSVYGIARCLLMIMFEIVPSEHAREVLRGKREFTDFEKATLIWNSPIASFDEKNGIAQGTSWKNGR